MAGLKPYLVHLDEPVSVMKDEAGRGCFGVVYKSRLNGAKCVVKKLHDILTGRGYYQHVSESQWRELVEKFRREIELLSKQRHPNIVQFLGVCGLDGDPRDISLVMEQLETDLKRFIESNRGRILLSIKLSILRDTACGVSHLHSSGIVHRDLNAGNVLLTTSLQAKVADLGVSRIIDSRPQYLGSLSTAPGATHYMPPEALQEHPVYGPKLDCFSFGHLMLYLVIEVYPQPMELCVEDFANLLRGRDSQLLSGQVQKRRKWIQMLGDDHPLNQLICVCLEDHPEKRPDMKTVRGQLEEMMVKTGSGIPGVMELMMENEEKEKGLVELRKNMEEKEENVLKLAKHIEEREKIVAEQMEEKEKALIELKKSNEQKEESVVKLTKHIEKREKIVAEQLMEKEEYLNKLKKENEDKRIDMVKMEEDCHEKERCLTQLKTKLKEKERKMVDLMEQVQKMGCTLLTKRKLSSHYCHRNLKKAMSVLSTVERVKEDKRNFHCNIMIELRMQKHPPMLWRRMEGVKIRRMVFQTTKRRNLRLSRFCLKN